MLTCLPIRLYILITLILMSFGLKAVMACETQGTLLDVYSELESDEKELITQALVDLELSENDLGLVEYEATCDEKYVHGSLSLQKNKLEAKQRKFLIKLGAGYIFPVTGYDITTKMGKINPQTGQFRYAFTLGATSTGQFKKGSFQTFTGGFNLYIKERPIYLGPIVQLLWINNPLLIGQQNYTFWAGGLQAGYEFPIKIGAQRKMDIDLHGYLSVGGLENNPKAFFHWGVGARINLPYKNKGR